MIWPMTGGLAQGTTSSPTRPKSTLAGIEGTDRPILHRGEKDSQSQQAADRTEGSADSESPGCWVVEGLVNFSWGHSDGPVFLKIEFHLFWL